MTPGTLFIADCFKGTTDEQRSKATNAAALVLPALAGDYNELEWFRLSAFALRFIAKESMPTQEQWDLVTDFINGTEAPPPDKQN
jgi:hypothetical protein